jgi:hypothetical protein
MTAIPSARVLALASACVLAAAAGACAFLDPLRQGGLGVEISPRDTALYVGARFQSHALMVNSFGDRYPSTHLRYQGPDTSASVSPGGIVTGIAFGRARLVVRRSALTDTGWVSVVPAGVLAVAASGMVRVIHTDGSGYQAVASFGYYSGGPSAWLPGGAGLLYQYADPMGQDSMSILAVDLAGGAPRLVAHGLNPRVSADGAWVYFQKPKQNSASDLWRVHLDGTGGERITVSGSYAGDIEPDPSPDGTQLAFGRVSGNYVTPIVIRTLAGGAERVLAVDGRLPRWSPAGDQIAYWRPSTAFGNYYAGEIVVANPDGTGAHVVSAAGRPYSAEALDWSPDGQWLVAHTFDPSDTYDPLDLIHVPTGLTLPLGYSSGFVLASWRR